MGDIIENKRGGELKRAKTGDGSLSLELEGSSFGGVSSPKTENRPLSLSPLSLLHRAGLSLEETPDGLVLTDGTLSLRADFERLLPRLRPANLSKEMLVKAAKIKGAAHPRVIDATAGLGEDSLLLAAAGFSVTLFENDPVIAALLSDALRRAEEVPEFSEAVSRMKLIEGDSIEAMRRMKEAGGTEGTFYFVPSDGTEGALHSVSPDSPGTDVGRNETSPSVPPEVILLDPMFPEREKSALVKKKFQLLQKLERPCADEEALFMAALGLAPKKIIVKRPLKGPYLAGKKPSYSLTGKAIRYDCYAG